MAGEAGGEPRAWLAVDETAATFISRSLSSRPQIILPPPLHRAPLRPGNVVEIAGPSNSGKSHLLLMAAVQCILPKEWEGIYIGGLGKSVMYLDLDCRFDVLRLVQILRKRIAEGSAHLRNGDLEKDGTKDEFQSSFENALFSDCMQRFLKSLQSVTETVIHEIRKFLQLQPALVLVTKAPIYAEGTTTANDFNRGSLKYMMEDSTVLKYSRLDEERTLSYREYMPSIWQSFVTHRINLQGSTQDTLPVMRRKKGIVCRDTKASATQFRVILRVDECWNLELILRPAMRRPFI
ncbi:hypothetical protein C2845_PM13G14620 [Panicum miliaceum]|uniref:Uncharacterized protein n=1 Tax=Panicum miliaceum TaxID=4540 RepID=A0A3L6RJ05_PANMI|nr:hypothetical protein C2845_PM13G14620 [Panicum miliaceum]